MKCSKIQKLFPSAMYGELNSRNLKVIEEHLKTCLTCTQKRNRLLTIRQWVKGNFAHIEAPALPADFEQLVYNRLAKECSSDQNIKRRFVTPRWIFVGSVAASVLVGFVSYFLLRISQPRILEGTLCVAITDHGVKTLNRNDSLPIGQTLKTSSDQFAKIRLRDNSILDLFPNTILTLKSDSSVKGRLLDLEEGELRCQVAKGGGFSINMPGAELKTLGTEFTVRLSTNRKEIITSQGNPLSFITSATVKIVVASGRISLTTKQEHRRLHQEVGVGETVIREIDPPLPVELQAEIKNLIQGLGNKNKAIQEKAFEALLKIGYAITPFLEEISLPHNSPLHNRIKQLRERFNMPEFLWMHEVSRIGFGLYAPVITDNQLFQVDVLGVSAIDCKRGVVNWTFYQEGFNSAPQVVDGIIYIGTLAGDIFALDAKKGDIIWQKTGLGVIQSVPTLVNHTIYLGGSEPQTNLGKFYALDTQRGEIKWVSRTEGIITSQAVVSQALVIIGAWNHKLYAFDNQTGEKTWDYATNGKIDTSAMVAGDLVYFGDGDGQLYCLSIHDGQKQWTFQTDSEIIESPIKVGQILYLGTKHKIYALDLEKRTAIWFYNREKSTIGTITVVRSRVYLGTDGGQVIALDAQTGEEMWKYNLADDYLVGSPTIFNDVLYIIARTAGMDTRVSKVCALKLK